MAFLYIVILIGVLVFVHEFGHYIAAKIFHVKVLSFSIGFGPRLTGFKRGETSWDIRLLPLGGYVQMYGTDFEEVTNTADPDFHRAYNNKPIWQKAIINLAGPLFNLLFPIPLLFAVYLATATSDYPPIVGQVMDNSPAITVLQPGDTIKSINGHEIRYWDTLHDMIADHPDDKLHFVIDRDGETIEAEITPEATVRRDSMDVTKQTVGKIGVTPYLASPTIGLISPQQPAAVYGLKSFDEITAINGQAIKSYVELESALKHNTANSLKIMVLRPEKLDLPYGTIQILTPVEIEIPQKISSAQDLGIASANMFLSEVDKDSPADKAGLKVGDRILELDGESVNLFVSLLDKLVQDWESPHKLKVMRNGQIIETQIQLEKLTITGEFQEEVPTIYAGFYHKSRIIIPERVDRTTGDRFIYATKASIDTTIRASTTLVVYVGKMFQGKVSTKNLGGPIMIGHMAQKAGKDGLDMFMLMMAIISINLGILNLLPIPLFDGGKLAILAVEAVKRGPLTMRTRQIIAYVGLAMVILIMMLAFKNDIERMWNLFFS